LEPTLRNRDLQRRLERDGWVVVPGLATEHLASLRGIADSVVRGPVPAGLPEAWQSMKAPGGAWELSLDHLDDACREEVEERSAAAWGDLVPALCPDHRVVLTAFLFKHPGADGVLPLHQDPTVVDERRHRSVTFWVPLDPISRRLDNGPLHVLPGSHRVARALRGTGTVPEYLSRVERLWRHAEPVDVEAGDVVVMDSRLVHGSPPNADQQVRRVMSGVVVPREAELVHVVARSGAGLEILRPDEAFFRTYRPCTRRRRPTTQSRRPSPRPGRGR
jgi:hypothetical protein